MLAPRAPQRLHARFGLRRLGQAVGVELAVAPRNVVVVDVVLDAEVVKRCEPFELDALGDPRAIRLEVIEQPHDVRGVGAIRRRGQAENEVRIADVVEDAPVRIGCRVMHLVDHHVVEVLGLEPREVLAARELGDRREHQVRRKLVGLAEEPADPRDLVEPTKLAPVGTRRLLQQFATMGDEQHAWPSPDLLPELGKVERREPRLPEARREHHDRAPPPLLSSCTQPRKRLELHVVRCGRKLDGFGLRFPRR